MSEHSLTLLYDGACPLCLRDDKFLTRRDLLGMFAFVDVVQPEVVLEVEVFALHLILLLPHLPLLPFRRR